MSARWTGRSHAVLLFVAVLFVAALRTCHTAGGEAEPSLGCCDASAVRTSQELEQSVVALAAGLASARSRGHTRAADELADTIALFRCVAGEERALARPQDAAAWLSYAHHLVAAFRWRPAARALQHAQRLLWLAVSTQAAPVARDVRCGGQRRADGVPAIEPSIAVHLPLGADALRRISEAAAASMSASGCSNNTSVAFGGPRGLGSGAPTLLVDAPFRPAGSTVGARVRLALVSPDFREHKAGQLRRSLVLAHDRLRFAVVLVCTAGRGDGARGGGTDALRAELATHAEALVVLAADDAPAAAELNALRPHVLVDLISHNRGGRPSLLLQARPAPLWLTYPDYPGPFGGGGVDLLVTDRVVSPPELAALQATEALLVMPGTFFLTDHATSFPRPMVTAAGHTHSQTHAPWGQAPSPSAARVDWRELSDCRRGGDVRLGAFNALHKADPDLFNRWLVLLATALNRTAASSEEGSTTPPRAAEAELHIGSGEMLTSQRMAMEIAQGHGVAHALRFPRRVPRDALLARMQCAAIVLDTATLNGIATTADALWAARAPVVTVPGETMGSRMAASMCLAAVMPGAPRPQHCAPLGVSRTRDDYGLLAAALYARGVRTGLGACDAAAATMPLFDATRWMQAWERGLAMAIDAKIEASDVAVRPHGFHVVVAVGPVAALD